MTESAYLQCFANWWALAGSNTPRVHDHRARPNVLLLKQKLGPITMLDLDMTHSQMLGKFEYTRGPIFKVVLEC